MLYVDRENILIFLTEKYTVVGTVYKNSSF